MKYRIVSRIIISFALFFGCDGFIDLTSGNVSPQGARDYKARVGYFLDTYKLELLTVASKDLDAAKSSANAELADLTNEVTDFFCKYMGCLYGSDCVLKDFTDIISSGAIQELEDEMDEVLTETKAIMKQNKEEELVEDFLENADLSNFVFDARTIAFFEYVFNNFEDIVKFDKVDNVEKVMCDRAGDFVYCNCKYGMAGERCDECSYGFSIY